MVGGLGGEILAVAIEEKQGDDQEGHQAQHEKASISCGLSPRGLKFHFIA